MDRIIDTYEFTYDEKNHLRYCHNEGVAYQFPMKVLAKYDKTYLNKCLGYEGSDISNKINDGRIKAVAKYSGETHRCLDIGIGSGEFIKRRNKYDRITFGTDVNRSAIDWLKEFKCLREDLTEFDCFTMWDVLEHVETPESYFKRMSKGSVLYVSIPIFESLNDIVESRHYRPNEHLYYFTHAGFVAYMNNWGFRILEVQDFETKAGRENIKTYICKKTMPDFDDLVKEYADIHNSKYYGHSGENLLPEITETVKNLNPKSILDYGCGRSPLVTYFYNDGQRQIYKYDPAIKDYKTMPCNKVDLVLCTDVLEHILIRDQERVLMEIRSLSENVIFAISTTPARQLLEDGRNAHVTVQPRSWWIKLLEKYFGKVRFINYNEHYMVVKTFK